VDLFNTSRVAEIHHHGGLVKLLHPERRQCRLNHAIEISQIAAVEIHPALVFQRDQLLFFPTGGSFRLGGSEMPEVIELSPDVRVSMQCMDRLRSP